jgi:hypothetical protein
MREHRGKIVLACLAITEGCWLYALLGVLGLITGQHGSPLPWLVVFLMLLAGMYAGWITMGMRGDPATMAIIFGGAGLVSVYFAVAAGSYDGRASLDMAWAARLAGGDIPAQRWVGTALALVGSVLLWRRAMGLVAERYVEERLQRSFKLGMAVIAVAVLAEQVSKEDLGARALLVPFFVVSLAGMAVARLPEQGVGAKTASWVRVIAVSVLAVIGVGLLLGLAGGVYGSGGVHLLYRGWGMLVDSLLWLIRYPLQLLVNGMLAFWTWIRNLLNPSGERVSLDPISMPQPPAAEFVTGGGGSTLGQLIVNILQYPLLVLLLVAIFIVLALAFRRLWLRRKGPADEDRESIEGEPDASGDLARLLKGLLPAWMRRVRPAELTWRYPEGEPGIGEVFRLYFDYLSAAIKRGMVFNPSDTPRERRDALQAALPGTPAGSVTERFNAACYGREPTDQATLSQLRAALEPSSAGGQ